MTTKPTEPFFVREAVLIYKPSSKKNIPMLSGAFDLAPFIRSLLGDKLVEHFIVVALSSRLRPMGWATVAIGSMTHCQVSVADILRFVVVASAPLFVVAHNHPSGDPTPSAEDILLTQRIGDAARLLGLTLLDHVIVTEDRHYSFSDAGAPGLGHMPPEPFRTLSSGAGR